jgi:hypothetical protein
MLPDDFSMRFNREEWGVITDALIQHRGHATERKSANSESTSDVRADMCADLIRRLNATALRTYLELVASETARPGPEKDSAGVWAEERE